MYFSPHSLFFSRLKNLKRSYFQHATCFQLCQLGIVGKSNQCKLHSVIHIARRGTKLGTYPHPRNHICYILLFFTVKHCWCNSAPLRSNFITITSFACSIKSSLRWCKKPYLSQAVTNLPLLPSKARYTVTAWDEFGLIWFSGQIHVGCNL